MMSLQSDADAARRSGAWLHIEGRHEVAEPLRLRDGVARLHAVPTASVWGHAVKGPGPLHVNGRLTVGGGLTLDRSYRSTVLGRLTVRDAPVGIYAAGAQSMSLDQVAAQDCREGVALDGCGGSRISMLEIDGCERGLVVHGTDSAGGVHVGHIRSEHTPWAVVVGHDVQGLVSIGGGHIEGGRILICGGSVDIRAARLNTGGADAAIIIEDCVSVVLDGIRVDTPGQAASWVRAPRHLWDRIVLRDCTYPDRPAGPTARTLLQLREG